MHILYEKEGPGMDDKTPRYLTVRISRDDFRKYKTYLQYIAKKSTQEDIREYVRGQGKLLDEKILTLAVSPTKRKKTTKA
jgi:hypothetical protein